MSVSESLISNNLKQLRQKKSKRNKKPERIVQNKVVAWLSAHCFDCDVIESKSHINPYTGRFHSQSAKTGFTDIAGNDGLGRAVFIELKAPKRRSTLRPAQRMFLTRKITSFCFAVVVDSEELLSEYYGEWSRLSAIDRCKARDYLFSVLPNEKKSRKPNQSVF